MNFNNWIRVENIVANEEMDYYQQFLILLLIVLIVFNSRLLQTRLNVSTRGKGLRILNMSLIYNCSQFVFA